MMTLDEVYDTAGAVEYINARLVELGQPGVAAATFKQHIHQEPWVQIVPIRVGAADGRASALAFTRRLLDDYIDNREHNRRDGVARRVSYPKHWETLIMGPAEAMAYVNDCLAADGAVSDDEFVPWATVDQLYKARVSGEIEGKVVGKMTFFLPDGLQPMINRKAREWREAGLRATAGYVLMRHCKADDGYIIVLDGRKGGDWVDVEGVAAGRWIVMHEDGHFVNVASKRRARDLAEYAAASGNPVGAIDGLQV